MEIYNVYVSEILMNYRKFIRKRVTEKKEQLCLYAPFKGAFDIYFEMFNE